MTYRDDLEAAHARTDALEQELAETRKRNAELEAENARTEVLAHEVAEMKKENVALQARLAPRIEITDLERAKYLADARRVLKLRLIATLVIIAGIIGVSTASAAIALACPRSGWSCAGSCSSCRVSGSVSSRSGGH